MNAAEIRNQLLSTLIADFQICEHCQIVDKDKGRIRTGYECPNCGNQSTGGMLYFEFNVVSTINLMQEFYHLKPETYLNLGIPTTEDEIKRNHSVAVVIIFCTLIEILLQGFLEKLMTRRKFQMKFRA